MKHEGEARAAVHKPASVVVIRGDLPAGFVLGPSVDAGFHVVLAPLQPGEHTIHFHADLPDGSIQDVTYELTIGRQVLPRRTAPTSLQHTPLRRPRTFRRCSDDAVEQCGRTHR